MTLALQLAAAAAAQPVDDTINPDRPGLADGSNVVGAGRVQVETGLQFRVESNTYTRATSRHPGGGERAPGHGPQGRPLAVRAPGSREPRLQKLYLTPSTMPGLPSSLPLMGEA
ncbi:hypothetical protein X551_00563 [Methylibium sp. T29]|nr:hypothetical protein X551_00563 [Methylibium sp. T29]EWS61521.1 hypothetical protein Y694_00691 [Methylibium sp. T29-B]